jgi:hypothetical protein
VNQIKQSARRQTIEIDDSGTGDLVGDAFIGFHVIETGKIIFRSVPVGLYNKRNHEDRKSKEYILRMIKDGLKTLKFNKHTDSIRICRGNCFDLAREWFDKEEIKHKPTIVEGKLQDAVEGRLISHLRKLGVKSKKLTKEAGAQRYFVLFNWVSRNFPEHERYVKSGFPAWNKKWREIAIERYQQQS